MATARTPVAGSERPPLEGARRVGDTDPGRRIEVTVTLRRKSGEEPTASMDAAALDRAEIAGRYGFPTDSNGHGQTVAIIELGGGFRTADLNAYWAEMGVSPKPRVVAVGVDGAGNHPDGPDGADGEVMLDIEVVGAVAPGARIAVYFAPNTTRGFLDAITAAIHDSVRKPSVISISWGQVEDATHGWTAQARR